MKVLKTKSVVASALVLSMMGAGCATPGKRTAVGAGAGAIVGAGAGALIGKGWGGAAIGAAAGAVAGGAVGNYLDKQAQELEKANLPVERTQDGAIVVKMPGDLLFATNSATLSPQAMQSVNELADVLVKYPEDRIQVAGHTDSTGSDEYNKQLSLKRADAVAQVLLSRGVKSEQIATAGAGELQPVADNATAEGRAKNRRVQLHIDVPQANQQKVEQKAEAAKQRS
ncbi:OmpA family protein [Aggregicoccus sp. 17bor-14]|uniref:OmpA family protein n=1 Tax=Myxococcaceae TaxID=31 RepID=UPI00129CC6E5|nr:MULTISPECIES: OmpA family protein [Myxococcaceae]MBF5043503.1 OmpA family protein [Simulacricoccus sp. 17bor-14]MRI89260.1 OmpA family protein [Aggregicoccus sp. 17bor-14]